MDDLTQQGIAALQEGNRREARRLLDAAVQARPDDALAWRSLADVVDSAVERRVCLERFLALKSDDPNLRDELDRMGPPPKPEPSPSQILSAIKTAGAAQTERQVGRFYWHWLHTTF